MEEITPIEKKVKILNFDVIRGYRRWKTYNNKIIVAEYSYFKIGDKKFHNGIELMKYLWKKKEDCNEDYQQD